jgi:hypothetical protein
MLKISNGLLLAKLAAPPMSAGEDYERWWMVPFPLRPDIAGAEAREDIKKTAAALMAPLIELDRRTRQELGDGNAPWCWPVRRLAHLGPCILASAGASAASGLSRRRRRSTGSAPAGRSSGESSQPHVSAGPRAFFLIFSVTQGDTVTRCSAMPTAGLLPGGSRRARRPADVR